MTEQATPAESLDQVLLTTLEELLDIPVGHVHHALSRAASLLADVLRADKVDFWLHEQDVIRVIGVSDTPVGQRQVALGLNQFTRQEQTRVWDVVDTGEPYLTGHADQDPGVHPGIVLELGIRSMAGVPLEVAGGRRGVVLLADRQRARFSERHLRFLFAVARWVGLVLRQSDLVEAAARHAAAEAERRTLEDLLQHAPPILALLNGPDLVFSFANASYQSLFPGRRLIGLPLRDALPELAGQDLVERVERVYRDGTPLSLPEVPVRLARGGGQLGVSYFNARFEPVMGPLGEVTGVLASGFEVTEQVLARRGLETAMERVQRLAADRAELLVERTRLLERESTARAEAEAAVQARDEFLSIASHELRNPLAALRGGGQLLQRRVERGAVDKDQVLAALERLLGSADRLGRLVDDLLDVSRLRTGQLPLRPVPLDLAEVVNEASARARDQSGRHTVHLEMACSPCAVVADRDRLHQVIDNLLDNAFKYAPAGGAVRVSLRCADGAAVLHVQDQGIGLPPGSEESIFQPFGRAPNAAAANIPGMGLGLYICRQIAEAHGGSLHAESPGPGQGTTFVLKLPCAPVSIAAA